MALQIVMLSAKYDLLNKIYEIYMTIFHILTLAIAILIFSILLIYTGVEMSKQKSIYPPIIPNCPDLWTIDNNGNCIIPQDANSNIGTLSSKPLYYYDNANANFTSSTMTYGYSFLPQVKVKDKTYSGNETGKNGYLSYDIPFGFDQANPTKINFNDPGWGSQGDPNCAMQLWAKQHGISWDGINAYTC